MVAPRGKTQLRIPGLGRGLPLHGNNEIYLRPGVLLVRARSRHCGGQARLKLGIVVPWDKANFSWPWSSAARFVWVKIVEFIPGPALAALWRTGRSGSRRSRALGYSATGQVPVVALSPPGAHWQVRLRQREGPAGRGGPAGMYDAWGGGAFLLNSGRPPLHEAQGGCSCGNRDCPWVIPEMAPLGCGLAWGH